MFVPELELCPEPNLGCPELNSGRSIGKDPTSDLQYPACTAIAIKYFLKTKQTVGSIDYYVGVTQEKSIKKRNIKNKKLK